MKKLNGNKENEVILQENYLNYNKASILSENTSVDQGRLTIASRATDRDHVFDSMYIHCGLSMVYGYVFYSLDRIIKDKKILKELNEIGRVNLDVYDDVTKKCYTGDVIEIHTSGSHDCKILCPDLTLCPDHLKNSTYTTWLKVSNFRPKKEKIDKSKFEKLYPNKYKNFAELEGKRWDFVYLKRI